MLGFRGCIRRGLGMRGLRGHCFVIIRIVCLGMGLC